MIKDHHIIPTGFLRGKATPKRMAFCKMEIPIRDDKKNKQKNRSRVDIRMRESESALKCPCPSGSHPEFKKSVPPPHHRETA